MPQSNDVRTNEIQNHAEHVHDQAAVSKGKQDHLSGSELQQDGQEKARETRERVEKLLKESEQRAGRAQE